MPPTNAVYIGIKTKAASAKAGKGGRCIQPWMHRRKRFGFCKAIDPCFNSDPPRIERKRSVPVPLQLVTIRLKSHETSSGVFALPTPRGEFNQVGITAGTSRVAVTCEFAHRPKWTVFG